MNVVPVKIYNDGLGIYFFVILHWALSANNWNSGNANEFNVNSNGNLNNNNVNNSDGVRPVVSLRTSTLVTKGTGTETDPYVIG